MKPVICHLPQFPAEYPCFQRSLLQNCYMASILKIGVSWRAQIRRKGHKPITETFPTKAAAQAWARKIEAEIDAKRFKDTRDLHDISLEKLIDRYTEEMDGDNFGDNKKAVLAYLKRKFGDKSVAEITDDLLTTHVRDRKKEGVSGVTINIELTYLGTVFKTARELWKLPISMEPIQLARANMRHLKLSPKSKERDRRPTDDEIKRICAWFEAKGKRQKVPMPDLILFAIETAMRAGEIINLRWDDLNETDKTIIIRDRKHPTEKKGNDQEVPLLGKAFEIVKRQPKVEDEPRIFPINDGTISSLFPRACRALGIEDLRFHDLRHEGVSRLFERGYRIEQVALVSGHRDWKMLARYTQIRAKDLHRTE